MINHYGNWVVDGVLGVGEEVSGGYVFPTTIGASAEVLIVTTDFFNGKHLQFKDLRQAPYNFATKDDIVTTLSGAPQYLTQLLDITGDFSGNKDRVVTVNSSETMAEFADPRASFEHLTKVSHGFSAGQAIYRSISGSYELAIADPTDPSKAEVLGVIESIISPDEFRLIYSGKIKNLSGLVDGEVYFLDNATPGALTTTRYTINNIIKPVLVATSATEGVVVNYVGFSSIVDLLASDNQYVVSISNVSGTITLNADDHYIRANAISGDFTIYLPNLATNVQRIYEIKKIDNTANKVTIVPNGGDTIENDINLILENNDGVKLVGGSTTNWDIN